MEALIAEEEEQGRLNDERTQVGVCCFPLVLQRCCPVVTMALASAWHPHAMISTVLRWCHPLPPLPTFPTHPPSPHSTPHHPHSHPPPAPPPPQARLAADKEKRAKKKERKKAKKEADKARKEAEEEERRAAEEQRREAEAVRAAEASERRRWARGGGEVEGRGASPMVAGA
jgi:hypothetical protein